MVSKTTEGRNLAIQIIPYRHKEQAFFPKILDFALLK